MRRLFWPKLKLHSLNMYFLILWIVHEECTGTRKVVHPSVHQPIGPYLQGKLWFISFQLVKWKIWKVMFYGHWRHLILKKELWTLFAGSILTIFKKEKLHRLWISFCNISTIGINKKLKFVSNSVFPFNTYSLLLIDFVEV
jgi:hypothetical protein